MSHFRSDEELAWEFLAGRVDEGPDGSISHKYLESNSAAERKGQTALARLLRSGLPLDHGVRWRLAAMLDPDSAWEDRKFKVAFRKRGNRGKSSAISIEIARYMATEIGAGCKVDAAAQAATFKYKASLSSVWRAWSDHKDSDLVQHLMVITTTVN